MKLKDLLEDENGFITNYDEIWHLCYYVLDFPKDKFSINDGIVDTNFNVSLTLPKEYTKLPFKFGISNRDFSLFFSNHITSLEGCPNVVMENFDCMKTHISSLIGGPVTVLGNYQAYSCTNLRNLDGLPKKVGKNLTIYGPNIDYLEYRKILYIEVEGTIHTGIDEIDTILNTFKGEKNKKHWPAAINQLKGTTRQTNENIDKSDIGPHQGKELALMLSGSKPAALLNQEQFKEFLPYVKAGKFLAKKYTGFSGYEGYIVSQRDKSDNLNKIQNLYTNGGPKTDAQHAELGKLLGYTDNQISSYLKHRDDIFKSKKL